MKKRILITGANGFLGSSLRTFIHENEPSFEVFGLDVKSSRFDSKTFICNLNDIKKLKKILFSLKPDYIFHFAGGRISDAKKLFEANFLSTKSLFEVIEKIGSYRPRFIIPGTAAEYGRIKGAKKARENFSPRPVSWYGFVKFMQTSLGLMYSMRGFHTVVARMFNISGKGVPPSLVIGRFAQEIVLIEKRRKKPLLQTMNLSSQRDFLDIEDICSALLQVAFKGKSGEIYNICSGRSFAVKDVLKEMLSMSTVKNIQIQEDKTRSSESFNIIGSNRKIILESSWRPVVNLSKSLQEVLNYYRLTTP